MSISILLADDHKIVRQGLRSLLEESPELKIVGEADNGRDAVQLAGELHPDIIVMDIGMPKLNGIEATRKITERNRRAKVIALSIHSDRRFVRNMFKAGAKGYLLKECAVDELIDAVQTVYDDKVYISSHVSGTLIEDYVRELNVPLPNVEVELLDREREILQLMAEENNTKEIASQLNLSGKTVDHYRRQLMEKLDIHSVAGLVKYAIREGIISL